MPNQPRPDNPARQVRVEDDLWHAAEDAAKAEGTTRAEVIRQALRDLVGRQVSCGFDQACKWQGPAAGRSHHWDDAHGLRP